jgi:hypothetical protein
MMKQRDALDVSQQHLAMVIIACTFALWLLVADFMAQVSHSQMGTRHYLLKTRDPSLLNAIHRLLESVRHSQ